MKPEKPSLKKTVKKVAQSLREGGASAADQLKKTVKAVTGKSAKASAGKTVEPGPVPDAPAPTAKKAASRKVAPGAPPIPPILLEGDQPPVPAASGPGERYALGPSATPQPVAVESSGELPEAYGTRRLLLAARDPHWLYARWDLTREQQKEYNSLSADRHLVLRIFVDEIKGEPFSQVHVHPESTHWFAHVGRAGTKYLGELGYYRANGKWVVISTSGATLTPPDTMSEDTAAQFATIPIEVPFAQLIELAKTAVRENIPLAEVLQQLRASGYKIPDAPAGKWTPEQERALAAIITMDRVRRVWMGSVEITELIRRQLQSEISSISAAQFGLPTSPFGAISSITSVTSPFGGAERRKGFWFNVNAELIIYGATEPDARVTIGGRVIKLRPDGSFSFRFALPDGEYELPAVAVSADKTDGRAAELKFSRGTEYRGEVGRHPQDPQLKTPHAANVS
jgi:hypothetical protein